MAQSNAFQPLTEKKGNLGGNKFSDNCGLKRIKIACIPFIASDIQKQRNWNHKTSVFETWGECQVSIE